MKFGKKFGGVQRFFELAFKQFGEVNMGNTAIVVAYYLLLALFPLLIFVANLLPMMGLKAQMILPYLKAAFPSSIYLTLRPIIMDFLSNSSGGLASITGLLTVWAASRGVNALKIGINSVYGVSKADNAITSRIFSFLMILLFEILVIGLFVVYSFGQMVIEYLTPIFHLSLGWADSFSKYKSVTTFLVLFAVMFIIYRSLTDAKTHIRYSWPGALFAALGWMTLTQGFSIYVKYFAKSVLSYGTIGTFIVLLFWLNFTAWVMLIGALINATLERYHNGRIEPKRTAIKRLYDRVDPTKKKNK